jgi:hypothetical protein
MSFPEHLITKTAITVPKVYYSRHYTKKGNVVSSDRPVVSISRYASTSVTIHKTSVGFYSHYTIASRYIQE